MSIRVNIGCGITPTKGWNNYDNSWSIRLAPILPSSTAKFFYVIGLLTKHQMNFINFSRSSNIRWANAAKRIPEKDDSVDVIYCSHMLEHLDKREVCGFLNEARRVLRKGGVIRLSVPDLRRLVKDYLDNGDADRFVEATLLAIGHRSNIAGRIRELLVGPRNHRWMYDGLSLCNLLESFGFFQPSVTESGSTLICDPGELDLNERSEESVFVEALNP
jgi:SAM-dependent methyltransferase